MARMIRKQVYIEARQDRALQECAKGYDVAQAGLIRRSIDQALSSATATPDPEAWKKLKRSMAQVRKKYGPVKPFSWTRDELYDR